MTKSYLEFKEFIKSYPEIEKIKKYESEKDFGVGALGFLRHFYVKVWGSYADYVENDLVLYKIFKKGNEQCKNNLNTKIQVFLLDSLYSTELSSRNRISEIVHNFDKDFDEDFDEDSVNKVLKNIEKENLNKENEFKLRKETSFFSKYFHWHNESNNCKPLPIYDLNVRVGTIIYEHYKDRENCVYTKEKLKEYLRIGNHKGDNNNLLLSYLKNDTVKNKLTYDKIKESIDKFICELLKDDKINHESLVGTNRINDWGSFPRIKNYDNEINNCLYNNVSIYRLVDKFLWLTYKIAEAKSEENEIVNQDAGGKKNKPQIPNEVMEEFNKLMGIIKPS